MSKASEEAAEEIVRNLPNTSGGSHKATCDYIAAIIEHYCSPAAERARIRAGVEALRQSLPDNSKGYLSQGVMDAGRRGMAEHNEVIDDVLAVIDGEGESA